MSRKKWEAYANLSQCEAFHLFQFIFEEQHVTYDVIKAPPIYMYDSQHEQLVLKTSDFTISLIYVSADPVTRFFSSIMGTSSHFNGITFISIHYKKESREKLASILQAFAASSPTIPWHLTTYPRFRFAIMLQWVTKMKWKSFLTS